MDQEFERYQPLGAAPGQAPKYDKLVMRDGRFYPDHGLERIVAIMAEEGLTAKASSIHVNGWFGGYDKLSTTRLMLGEDFGIDIDADRESWVFAGDSPNDQPMFGFFPNAVGVANVRDMASMMSTLPAWITPSRGAEGFVELAESLLAAR